MKSEATVKTTTMGKEMVADGRRVRDAGTIESHGTSRIVAVRSQTAFRVEPTTVKGGNKTCVLMTAITV